MIIRKKKVIQAKVFIYLDFFFGRGRDEFNI